MFFRQLFDSMFDEMRRAPKSGLSAKWNLYSKIAAKQSAGEHDEKAGLQFAGA